MSDDVSAAFQFTIAVVRSQSLCVDLCDTICNTAWHMAVTIQLLKKELS